MLEGKFSECVMTQSRDPFERIVCSWWQRWWLGSIFIHESGSAPSEKFFSPFFLSRSLSFENGKGTTLHELNSLENFATDKGPIWRWRRAVSKDPKSCAWSISQFETSGLSFAKMGIGYIIMKEEEKTRGTVGFMTQFLKKAFLLLPGSHCLISKLERGMWKMSGASKQSWGRNQICSKSDERGGRKRGWEEQRNTRNTLEEIRKSEPEQCKPKQIKWAPNYSSQKYPFSGIGLLVDKQTIYE